MAERRFDTPVAADKALVVLIRQQFPGAKVNVERLALIWSQLWFLFTNGGPICKSYAELKDANWEWLSIKQVEHAFSELVKSGLLSREESNSGCNTWIPIQPTGSPSPGGVSPRHREGVSPSPGGGLPVTGRGHNITVSLPKEDLRKESKAIGKISVKPVVTQASYEELLTKLPDDKCRTAWQIHAEALRLSRHHKRIALSVLYATLAGFLSSVEQYGFTANAVEHALLACSRASNGPAQSEVYFRKAASGYRPELSTEHEPVTPESLRELALSELGLDCKLADVKAQIPSGKGSKLSGGWLEEWEAVEREFAKARAANGEPYEFGFLRNLALSLIAAAAHADLWPNAVAYGLQQLCAGSFDFNGCKIQAVVKYVIACAQRSYKMPNDEHYAGSPNHFRRKQQGSGLLSTLAGKMTGWQEEPEDDVPAIEDVDARTEALRRKYLEGGPGAKQED